MTQASVRLQKHKAEILRDWEGQLRKELAVARAQSRPLLIDSMPIFLDDLVAALTDKDATVCSPFGTNVCKKHGEQRATLEEYSLSEIVTEYRVLREILIMYLDTDGRLSVDERRVVHKSIDHAIEEATDQYSVLANSHDDALKLEAKRSDTRLKQIADSLPVLIAHIDASGRYTFCNRTYEEWFKRPRSRIIGVKIKDLIGDEAFKTVGPHVEKVLSGDTTRFEGVLPLPGGKSRDFSAIYTPEVGLNGAVIGFTSLSMDVTDRKIAEQNLHASLSDLRTERELRERFVATLSHDLRNALAAAKISAQLLIRYPDQIENVHKFSARIVDGIVRTDRMIQDLLDANRIKAGGRLPAHPVECDLRKVVQIVIDELSTIHGERFQIEAPEKVMGYWDARELRRALENLIINGIKYGDSIEPVTIRLNECLPDKVELSVHNFGSSIPKNELATLFEPYRRSSLAETSGKKGWGLGLVLVKGTAEAHGGEVRVSSNQIEGTTFTITLPRDARRVQNQLKAIS